MQRRRHETVATVLVDPAAFLALELALVGLDLWLWPVATAPNAVDGPRQAFQLRRRLVEAQRGGWDAAADWVVCWISFGTTWREGTEPVSWQARRTLYAALDSHAAHVRYRRGLGGVPPLTAPQERTA
jgi:hypothetical protein